MLHLFLVLRFCRNIKQILVLYLCNRWRKIEYKSMLQFSVTDQNDNGKNVFYEQAGAVSQRFIFLFIDHVLAII